MNLKKFVPKKSHSGSRIKATIINGFLTLETDKWASNKAILREKIEPTEAFWFGLGLYEAEKSKSVLKKDGRLMASKVAFTNKDPKIINSILQMFEELGIKRGNWKGEIYSNLNFIDKPLFEKNNPKQWSKLIGIPKKNLEHFKYDRREPKKLKKYNKNFLGIMTVYQYNLCLKSFLDNLINTLYPNR